jgi:hypothetical protein
MAFITYYFKSESGVIRCCAEDFDKDFFLAMGAKLTPAEFEQTIPSGDSGSGEYGSKEWHTNKILEMEYKQEVVNYTDSIKCADYDKRGGIEIVKEKAIQALSDD